MAVTQELTKRNLIITVEDGVDGKGQPKYKARTYSGVKGSATVDNLFAAGSALAGLMEAQAVGIGLSEKSDLVENA